MEEEEFKGDVTDACVIDRGNGEYQVVLLWRSLCSVMSITQIQLCFTLVMPLIVTMTTNKELLVNDSVCAQIQFKGTRSGPVEIDVVLNGERVRGCPFMCHQLDISDWGTPEVVEWITELGFPEYAPMFEEQCVEGYMLVGLTLDDLVTSFRVEKMGHRNVILRAVRRLLFSDVSPANIKRIDEPTLV